MKQYKSEKKRETHIHESRDRAEYRSTTATE